MEMLRHFEFGLSPAALLMLVAYHIYLYRKLCSDPLSTSLGLARRTCAMWVQSISMERQRNLAGATWRRTVWRVSLV
jgi:hypothetical protein